jgi:hypothetical protein
MYTVEEHQLQIGFHTDDGGGTYNETIGGDSDGGYENQSQSRTITIKITSQHPPFHHPLLIVAVE